MAGGLCVMGEKVKTSENEWHIQKVTLFSKLKLILMMGSILLNHQLMALGFSWSTKDLYSVQGSLPSSGAVPVDLVGKAGPESSIPCPSWHLLADRLIEFILFCLININPNRHPLKMSIPSMIKSLAITSHSASCLSWPQCLSDLPVFPQYSKPFSRKVLQVVKWFLECSVRPCLPGYVSAISCHFTPHESDCEACHVPGMEAHVLLALRLPKIICWILDPQTPGLETRS